MKVIRISISILLFTVGSFVISCKKESNASNSSDNLAVEELSTEELINQKEDRDLWANVDKLRVRSAPDLSAKVISSLKLGDKVHWNGVSTKKVITAKLGGEDKTGPFYKVNLEDKREGWVFSAALSQTDLSSYWVKAECPRGIPEPQIDAKKYADADFTIDNAAGQAEETMILTGMLDLKIVHTGCEYIIWTYTFTIKEPPVNVDMYDSTYWYPEALNVFKIVKSKKAVKNIDIIIKLLEEYIKKDNFEFETLLGEEADNPLATKVQVYEPKLKGSSVEFKITSSIGPI